MIDLNDTPYEKIVDTLIVPTKLYRLIKGSTVIGDSYVRDDEMYAVDKDGKVHWFKYMGTMDTDYVQPI